MLEEEIANGWIKSDESAKQMVGRVLKERPILLLPPPLDRVPLRAGNVVEIVGPSLSAKTQILIQAAITCILPKNYGGMERVVVFFDLDCRFDIQRLSQSLRNRIAIDDDDELFVACMRRFLYVRCYNSLQCLANLKTLHHQLPEETKVHGVAAYFLIIDSISAFYWIDRDSTPVLLGNDKRKNFSLHTVVETVVKEIQKLLQVQPMLILATKTTILGEGSSNDQKGNFRKSFLRGATDLVTPKGSQRHSYREFMPSTWQHFVTHRILVQVLDEDIDKSKHQNKSTYISEWLLPSLSFLDKFQVNDAGIYMIT